MEEKVKYIIDIELSKEDKKLIDDIKRGIEDDKFKDRWKWDSFVTYSLLVFNKMLELEVTHDQFKFLCENPEIIVKSYEREKEKIQAINETKLDDLVGLQKIKTKVKRLGCLIEKVNNNQVHSLNSMNYVFLGNPGTGKTITARALASEFFKRKIIPENKVIEVSRSDLIGEYMGQTTPLVKKCFDKAIGGILFIDEAYSLNDESTYCHEALCAINKFMEDYRGKLVVIFVGYKDETLKMLNCNRGLKSRINAIFEFPDYTESELKQILNMYLKKANMKMEKDAYEKIIEIVISKRGKKEYGNARDLRNVFEGVLEYWAERTEDYSTWNIIKLEDLLNWQIDNKVIIDNDVCDA